MSTLKGLVPQHYGVPRQDSSSQRPPAERVLLRRVYFLNSDRSKYVCLSFYPDRGYRAFFELDGVRQAPVVLPPFLILTLALHLPKLCENLFRGEQYKVQRDVVSDANRHEKLGHERSRSHVHYRQVTRNRVPGAESHNNSESDG